MSAEHAVWKFAVPFPGSDLFGIEMPSGAEILTVQMQSGEPQIWALVTPVSPTETRRFRIAETGHPITETIRAYIGTFQIAGGALVFHIFEVAP